MGTETKWQNKKPRCYCLHSKLTYLWSFINILQSLNLLASLPVGYHITRPVLNHYHMLSVSLEIMLWATN